MIEMKDCLWKTLLKDEIESERYKNFMEWLEREYKEHEIYPKKENIFHAYECVDYNQVKVVIIGQDPYHEPNQAQGLSFSVPKGEKIPPSLINIYKEIKSDIGGDIPEHGDLSYWTSQGVLLLNSVLTVERGLANSHKGKYWEYFTDETIKLLNKRDLPVVFMLWGNYAKKKAKLIDSDKHVVLSCSHPSPMSANQGGWFGCKHFSRANDILASLGVSKIDWQIR